MLARSQLEGRITEALVRLSPENMQRVAEDYARIRYPERFPRFDFRAFSEEGRGRQGWPDAWVCVNGRVDGVEATADKSKSGVKNHIEADLKKAIDRDPPLTGLIIVSGSPSVQPSAKKIDDWRRRFVDEAGMNPDRIDLVFGGRLIEELTHPEFVRTRIEVLGLRDAPVHFKLVRAGRGPDEGRLNPDFVPSEGDYVKGRVHRPAAAEEVNNCLRREGCALVRGVGASGKTVLAWLLALERAKDRTPSYYLDLAGYTEADPALGNALVEDLKRFGHRDSLVILDNCHLEESLTKEVVLEWKYLFADQRPLLLLVGRELRTARGSAIEGLSLATTVLRAQQAEVLGVYRRLAERDAPNGKPPEPPVSG